MKKKILFTALFSVALYHSMAFAAAPTVKDPAMQATPADIYISGQLGLGLRDIFGGSVVGRAAAGVDINPYLGLEAGATQWSDVRYTFLGVTTTTHVYTLDALGKLSYPFKNGFRVFVKAGAAYEHYSAYARDKQEQESERWDNVSAWRPELGGGFGYDFNPHWSADLTYSSVFGGGYYPPILNMVTVGLTYKIF